jgi:hypothetical protein
MISGARIPLVGGSPIAVTRRKHHTEVIPLAIWSIASVTMCGIGHGRH